MLLELAIIDIVKRTADVLMVLNIIIIHELKLFGYFCINNYECTDIKKDLANSTRKTALIVLDLISLHRPTYYLFEYIVI